MTTPTEKTADAIVKAALPGSGMTFRQYGRSYHMVIESVADLRRAISDDFDEALWVATSAPIETLNADPVFLKLVDNDADTRIKIDEFRDAVEWIIARLTDYTQVDAADSTIVLDAIDQADAEGSRIHASATKMLERSDTPDDGRVTLGEIRQFKKDVEAQPVSEAGVVLPQAATEEGEDDVADFLSDIVRTIGGVEHPSGRHGVDLAKLVEFRSAAQAYLDWHARGETDGEQPTEIMPLGDQTPAAFGTLSALRSKIDQYFAQCEAVRHDSSLVNQIWPRPADHAVDMTDRDAIHSMLRDAPIAEPRAEATLEFDETLNPIYADQLAALRDAVLQPVLGESTFKLTESDWLRVVATLAPYEKWLAEKAGGDVESLGEQKLRHYLDEPKYSDVTRRLIARSSETAFVLDNIRATEKLALYQAHILKLANNYVAFPDLYEPERRALFEEGTLIMDGRRFNFAIRVTNRGEHIKVAETSAMFVMYVELSTKEGGEKYEVAVPVTSGTQGNLCVGKRGVFQHIDGREWAARVVHIIDQPISLREAIWAPFQRLGSALTGRIEAITTAAEKKLDTTGADAVTRVHDTVGDAAATPTPPAQTQPAPHASGSVGGTLAGGGIAIAALGSAGAFITKTLAGLQWWEIAAGIGAAILAVIIPTTIVAIIKLRRRDLSAILEGSAWAINARMRLSRAQRLYFTQRPKYPRGSRFIRGTRWWLVVLVLAALIIGIAGYFYAHHKIGQATEAAEKIERPLVPAPVTPVESDDTPSTPTAPPTDTTPGE